MKTVKELLSQIKKDFIGITRGNKTLKRPWRDSKEANTFIRKVNGISLHYAHILGYTQQEVLHALEEKRTYWSANYYGNMSRIGKNVHVFDNDSDIIRYMKGKRFKCPACGGLSTDPQVCNTGAIVHTKSGICDWKSYGLFGCLGGGYSYVSKRSFLERPGIHTIFTPVDITQKHKVLMVGTPINSKTDIIYRDKWVDFGPDADSLIMGPDTPPVLRRI